MVTNLKKIKFFKIFVQAETIEIEEKLMNEDIKVDV